MNFTQERVEYYKNGRNILEVTTCDCCFVDGRHDTWFYKKGDKPTHCGFSPSSLKTMVLITRKEAERLVSKMGHKLFIGVGADVEEAA